MNIFTRLSNGWTIALNSFTVLKENRQLILFPILSGISMILIIGSFVTALLASGWDVQSLDDQSRVVQYAILFVYYLINYTVIVFSISAWIFSPGEVFLIHSGNRR